MDNSRLISKIDTVMQHIKQLISAKHLLAGSKLPSIRQLAKQLHLSTSTVVEAYERLVAEGVVLARAGAGYFVADFSQSSYVISVLEQKIEREIDPLWVSRQSLECSADALKPGCGWLPNSWLPEQIVRKAIRDTAQSPLEDLLAYAQPLGYAPLRQLIARRMNQLGVISHMAQILLTDCGTQALDLLFRLFLEAGDCVLIDDPCYFNFQALLKLHKVQIIAIPYLENGPDVEAFAAAAAKYQPKLYVTNAAIHNPTGAILAPSVAYQILKIVEKQQMILIEDDIFADFENLPAPRYAALAGFSHVVQVGSFSKSVSASIRCGYIAVKQEWLDLLINLKIATTFSNNTLNSKIIYQTLSHPQYRKHIENMRLKLAQAMTHCVNQLEKLPIQPRIIPRAGLFLWCQLDPEIDMSKLSQYCLQHGVILAPGRSFSQSASAAHCLRFNVAQSNDQKIYRILKLAIDAQS